jgi:hypothetical protein
MGAGAGSPIGILAIPRFVTLSDEYGGGIYIDSSSPTLMHVSLFDNTANIDGGGFFVNTASPALTNALVWGNTPNQLTGIYFTLTVTYSDIQGGYSGDGNIDLDPVLGPLADHGGFTKTHALLAGSHAIDAGTSNGCPRADQRGYFRPIDGNKDGSRLCDMGSYEYNSFLVSYLYLPLLQR